MTCHLPARGIALVTVLWLIALLTLLATSVVTISLTHRRTVQRYAEATQADSTIDSALRVVLLRLIAPSEQGTAWPLDQTQGLSIFEQNIAVTVQRELGRVDLNSADSDLLTAVFAANGWREKDARSMAARIIDWRGPDDETVADLTYGSHNGPLESVDELRQVLGSERIGTDLFDAFTVFTHSPGPVESAARPAVKRALEWADARQLGGHRWLSTSRSGGSSPRGLSGTALSGEVLRVRACLHDQGMDHCRVAVIRLTGNRLSPFQIFEWRAAPTLANTSTYSSG
jgi:general secretion pathway protein K